MGTGALWAGCGERGAIGAPSASARRGIKGRNRCGIDGVRGEARRVGTGALSTGKEPLGRGASAGHGGWRLPFLAGQWSE